MVAEPYVTIGWHVVQSIVVTVGRTFAGTLLYNLCHTDWRDVIPRINLPTLIIGGRASAMPWKSQEWIHRQIKGSQFEVFEEAEGGQHFMFIENPEKFNRLVMEYLG
jgi:non-heme chloroperoxidase